MTYSLIPSAAYIDMELAAEYGRLPPAFLPVGHQRLYELQLDVLGRGGDIYLSLPHSFDVPEADAQILSRRGVRLLQIPDGLTLGRSIQYALDLIGNPTEPLRILHGDTLIPDAPLEELDVVAVGLPPHGYAWGQFDSRGKPTPHVLAGYFALSDAVEFRRSLALADGNFTRALSIYSDQRELKQTVVDTWLDFGHLQPYYRARCGVQTQRSFNELHLNFQRIRKTGHNHAKIRAEAAWFRALPEPLRLYTPAYLGSGDSLAGQPWYELEYLPLPSLHELLVFGELEASAWRNIFSGCVQFIQACIDQGTHWKDAWPSPTPGFRETVQRKTDRRLLQWLPSKGYAMDTCLSYGGVQLPSLEHIVRHTAQEMDAPGESFHSVMHGDLCFTNIFFDFRTMRIRAIDPRGAMDDGECSIFGDWRYDLAKISHSLIGCYDLILAGRYRLVQPGPNHWEIVFAGSRSMQEAQNQYGALDIHGLHPKSTQIIAIVIHLFLSMLPLHADRPDRQDAFFANALRLYYEYFL